MQNEQFQGSNESQKETSLIMTSVYNAIKNGQSPEDAYDALVARKIESKQAVMIVDSVIKYMIENDEYTEEDEENNKIAREEEEQKYEDPNQAIEQQKDEEAENQMNQYNEQSLEVANDTSAIDQEEEDAANSSQDYLGFQYGGALGQAFENEEEDDEEEEEKYYEDDQIIKDQNNDFISELERLSKNGIAQNFDFSDINNYQIPYQPIFEPNDYYKNDSDYENNLDYAKYGGNSNKKYASNVFNLLKKQDGGEEDNLENEENVENEPFQQATQTDDLKDSVKKRLTDFVGAVGMTSKKYKMDEWFKKMKEVNDPMLEEIINPQSQNNPIQDQNEQAAQMLGTQNSTSSALGNQQDSMAYGGESSFSQYQKGGRFKRAVQKYFPGEILGSPKKSRNVITRVYNPKTGQMINLPTGDSKFDRVEVTKRNWLHQPKKYTVYYKNGNVSDIAPLVDSRNSSLTNQNQRSNVDGLSLEARMAIRKEKRQNERNSRRLKRQGLDEYGNLIGSEQSDKIPLSNKEMLIKQGKIWDEKSKRWIVKPEPLSAPMQYMKDSLTVPNNPQPFSFDQLINTSGPRNNEMQSNEMYDYKDIDVLNGDYNNDGYVNALDFVYSPEQVYLGTGNLNKSQDPELWKDKKVLNEVTVKPILKQYGGAINKFLPKKTIGGPPPCGAGETLDPTTNKCVASTVNNNQPFTLPEDNIFSSNTTQSNSSSNVLGPPVIAPVNDFWANQDSFNKPNNVNVDPKYDSSLDPNVISRLPTVSTMDAFNNSFKKKLTGDEETAIDIEKQNNKGKLTFGKNNTGVSEARLNLFNTGVDMLDSASRNIDYKKSEAEMQENTSSNNVFANKSTLDKGDYDTNSGLFRPNEMGQKRDSRSAQYGGYIDEEEYYDPYLEEDEEDEEDELTYAKGGEKITYMSEDQIRAFMAAGGQVEFL